MFENLRARVHTVSIDVDGQPVTFYLRELPFSVVARYYEESDHGELMLRLIVASLCDQNGNPIFANDDEGMKEVRQWKFKPVNELANKIVELNQLHPDPWNSTKQG